MKNFLPLFYFVILFSCSNEKLIVNTLSKDLIYKDSLSSYLCEIYGFDQGIREVELSSVKDKFKIDSLNFYKLNEFVKNNGFPNKILLGDNYDRMECVELSAAAILLHNPHRLVNDKSTLDIYINEVKKGSLDVNRLAVVLDKYYWLKSENEVLYGTAFGKPCKHNKIASDSVRAVIGLSPLEENMFRQCEK